MKSTQRDDGRQGIVSQQKHLSFYEENYILEPEDYEEDRGYFEYERMVSVLQWTFLESSYLNLSYP